MWFLKKQIFVAKSRLAGTSPLDERGYRRGEGQGGGGAHDGPALPRGALRRSDQVLGAVDEVLGGPP